MKVNRFITLVVLCVLAFGLNTLSTVKADESKPIKPHVMIIAMFGNEAESWIANEGLTEQIPVPGLSQTTGSPFLYPAIGTINFNSVKCTPAAMNNSDKKADNGKWDRNTCLVITDQAYANAASSISALIYSGKFDLTNTYFIIAGIAGVDPRDGTLGGAAWARYSVDFGLAHEIDGSEKPSNWPDGYTGFGPVDHGVKPARFDGTEVYHLNETLWQKAYHLTKNVVLLDTPTIQAYRSHYTNPDASTDYQNARNAPKVIQCDSVAVDTYWHGRVFSKRANDWSSLLTDGKANYCMTDEEDNATLTALKRGATAGLLNFDRIALLRTASNFDQQQVDSGQTAFQSLQARSGGFVPSLRNAYTVGSVLLHDINTNWAAYKTGVPADGALSVVPNN